MFCSTIIPTVGRSTLGSAVESVLNQAFRADDFEVIVVNDSGSRIPDAAWQHSPRVRLVDTQRRERSVARNTGAAIAHGRYLHFLDDDDLLLPGALERFWHTAQTSNASWLFGSYQSVDNNGTVLHEFDPPVCGNIFALLVAGEAIPFQASLLDSRSFFAAGMFDPLLSAGEDRDVGRRLALIANVERVHTTVAQIRVGQAGSTTNWAMLAENDRWGREKVLCDKRARHRLEAAAHSAYIRGRISKSYLASMLWNVRRQNYSVAASRAVTAISFARWHMFNAPFWKGVRAGLG